MKSHAVMLAATLLLGAGSAVAAMPSHVPSAGTPSAESDVTQARVVCDWRGCYERGPQRRYGQYQGRQRGWEQPRPSRGWNGGGRQPGYGYGGPPQGYRGGAGGGFPGQNPLVPPSTNANGGNQN